MKKFDWYIIKKFLGTFFYTMTILLLVVIVIDISEKIDNFNHHNLSFFTIISEYYLHFIPYFANLLSPLFIFISVVFFTSKLAVNSEIIAIFNSGMSFKRFLRPFIISAVFLSVLSFILGSNIIPISNKYRIDFENKYIKTQKKKLTKGIHLQKTKNHYYYLDRYDHKRNIGKRFSVEKFENGKLKNKLRAEQILWNKKTKKWTLKKCEIRTFYDNGKITLDTLSEKKDTTLMISPSDFIVQLNLSETMNLMELNRNIELETIKSSGKAKFYKIEKHKRIAFPFAIIILTIIAVALSSKKKKSGVGTNMGIGLLISFSYILFFQFSSTLSTNGTLEPWIAVWIPNILYIFLGILLLNRTQNI